MSDRNIPALDELLSLLGVGCKHEQQLGQVSAVLAAVVARMGGTQTLSAEEMDLAQTKALAIRGSVHGVIVSVVTVEQAKQAEAEMQEQTQNAPSTSTPQ